jgi:hypothetical protein
MSLARRVVTSMVALFVVVAGLAVVSPAAQASTASSLYGLTNASRASAGLAPYAYSSELSAVAFSRAQSMVAHNALTHAGLASAVGNWSYLGENVGYGPSAAALEVAFMNSADHRANIHDHDFTQVGVGAVTVGATVWVSVIFRKPMHSTSTGSSGGSTHIGHVVARQATSTSAQTSPSRPARLKPSLVPAPRHGGCLISPVAVQQILGLASEDHSVRLVAQSQRLVLAYQCGRGLPLTGLLDPATLRSLTA